MKLLRSSEPIYVSSIDEFETIKDNYFRRQFFSFICSECNEKRIARKDTKSLKIFICKYCLNKISHTGKKQSIEVIEKRKKSFKKTCQEKYGVDNVFQLEKVKNKIKETSLIKYGIETPGKSKQAIEKQKQTMVERYGVEYFSQNDFLKEKSNLTKLEKYGNKNYNNREKCKQTCLKKYGVDNSFKSEAVREKWQQTMLEKYGSTHPFFGHSFYEYDNIIFDSSWELIYFVYLKLNNINFKYHSKRLEYYKENKKHTYEVDFEIGQKLIEIKGPQFFKDSHLYNPFTESFEKEKEQCMLENNVVIISDISKEKRFVFEKFGNDFIECHRIK